MEYPNHVPRLGKQLLNRFENFNNELGPTLYITGNHDNWTRNHLQQRGFFLEHEYFTFQNGDKTIMTLHGDGLSDPQHRLQRPFMHRFLRNKDFIKIYQKLLPPKTGLTFMKYFSRLTRNYEWKPEKKETLNNWAEQKLQQSNIDIILSGHDHCPRKEQFPFGTYINLGTFYKHRTLAFYNDSDVTLVFWENKQKSLKPFNGIDE
jgi:UDP-2,3-diacylglucosamine pyrophosphatase LpxH